MYKISKIAEDNVETIPIKKMTDINGMEFEVLDKSRIETFGQVGLTSQLAEIDKQILYWTNFNEKAYKQTMLDKVQARKDLLLEVRTELEK